MYNYETHQPFRTTATGALWGKTTEFIVERPREHNSRKDRDRRSHDAGNGRERRDRGRCETNR
jgi:hypothetical protein